MPGRECNPTVKRASSNNKWHVHPVKRRRGKLKLSRAPFGADSLDFNQPSSSEVLPEVDIDLSAESIAIENTENENSQPSYRNEGTIGAENFHSIRYSSYFRDKTKLIELFMRDNAKTVLITAPARFGKSINLNMTSSFLRRPISEDGKLLPRTDIKESAFEGTDVAKDINFVKQHYQKYITVEIDLNGTVNNYEEAFRNMQKSIRRAYEKHRYLENYLKGADLYHFKTFTNQYSIISKDILEGSLFWLLNKLHNHHRRYSGECLKVVLLVDEFDALITSSMFSEENPAKLKRIAILRDKILGEAVKSSDGDKLLAKTILTGITDICCVATSSLLGITRYSFLHPNNPYAPYYGISKSELKDVLKKNVTKMTFKELCDYYNGYKWNSTEMLNTWSILQSIHGNRLDPFFATVSTLIMNFKPYLRCTEFEEMIKELVKGREYECETTDFYTMINLELLSELAIGTKDESKMLVDFSPLYSLLYQMGWISHGSNKSTIRVPNEEIRCKLLKDFYSSYFIKAYGLDEDKVKLCRKAFDRIITPNFNVKKFCKSFHALCFAPSCSTKYKINHSFMQALILIITSETAIKIRTAVFEFPVKEVKNSYRCDAVFYSQGCLIIIELKYNKSAEKAIDQIRDKAYMDAEKRTFIKGDDEILEKYILLGINVENRNKKKKTKKETTVIFEVLDSNKDTVDSTKAVCDQLLNVTDK